MRKREREREKERERERERGEDGKTGDPVNEGAYNPSY